MIICHVDLEKGFRGGERQASILIKELSQDSSISQYLVCRAQSPLREFLKDTPNLTFISAKSPLQGHFKLLKKADILHCHDGRGAQWCGVHHLLFNTPFVISRRVPKAVRNSLVNRYIYAKVSKLVPISNCISRALFESIGKAVDLKSKSTTIYDAFEKTEADIQAVQHIKAQYQGKTIIGHIGAYVDRHKGQSVLIEAGKKFLEKHPDTVFLFLGAGDDLERFKTQAKDERFKFLGFKKNVVDYIEAFDLFAFPSRNEGLGSTLLDVMDHNIPIIASNVDGIPEIVIHEKTGLLFENGNADDLYSKLEQMYQDKQLQQTCINNAKAQLDNFTAEHMTQSYKALYEEILKGK